MSEEGPIEQRFSVEWRFPVHFSDGIFDVANPLLASLATGSPSRAMVFVDGNVARANADLIRSIFEYFATHGAKFLLVAPPVLVEGGERVKDGLANVEDFARRMLEAHLDRQAYAIIVGGGAVLDAVGLAAALVHRGLRVIRVPTTVLAQNDAGVGVKNGVNDRGSKNALGTFAPPFAVLNDFSFLRTLPDPHWRSGIAEAWKVAIIRDAEFFEFLCEHAGKLWNRDEPAMRRLVRRCAELHLEHIRENGDPFEMGSARPLDFGHWSAHKLERNSVFRIPHGEAVAAGVLLDSLYASLAGSFAVRDALRTAEGLRRCGFVFPIEEMQRRDPAGRLLILEGLADFQEHLGGELTVTLPDGLGRRMEVHALDERLIEAALARLAELAC
jgi:3-dehydroquinate synthase